MKSSINTTPKEENTIKNTEEKKVVIDLINKIKYEFTEEQFAQLSGMGTPLTDAEFTDWHEKIDELDLTSGVAIRSKWLSQSHIAQLRELMHRITDITRTVGGKAVKIGKRIVSWIFSLLQRYPSTMAAFVVMAALVFLATSIPLIGRVLGPLFQTLALPIIGIVFCLENLNAMVLDVEVKH